MSPSLHSAVHVDEREGETITLFLLVTTFLAIFQHANIRTPQWLGYHITLA